MKKLWICIAICIVTILIIGIVSCAKKRPEEIKIGAILPLTGDTASYGVALKKGMDLAIEKINSQGGINTKKLMVIFEDSQADPSKGVSAFTKLVTADKVPIVIGDMFSAGTLAMTPIAEKNKVVLLSPTASAVELTTAGDYIFRIYPSDTYDGIYLANFVSEKLKARSASIIYLQVTSISAVSQVFKERFESLGGIILGADSYKEGDTDFRGQLIKAKEDDPDIIFIPGYLKEMAMLLRQAKELAIKKTFLSISTFYDPKILELSGGAAEGVLFSSPFFDPKSASVEVEEFVESFKSKYNNEPDILAGYGYDVVNIATEAIKACYQMAPDNIKEELYNIKDYPGVTGKTSFDSNGDVVKELKMMQVKDGTFVTYE